MTFQERPPGDLARQVRAQARARGALRGIEAAAAPIRRRTTRPLDRATIEALDALPRAEAAAMARTLADVIELPEVGA